MKYKNSFYDTIILAGGRSKRFGSQKCCFNFLGKPLIEWVLKEFDSPTVVCKREVISCISDIENVRIYIEGDNDFQGPINAIKKVLNYIKFDNVFITGCDYPFIKKGIADILCSRDGEIRILFDGDFQPLIACYSTNFLRKNINHIYKMKDLLKLAKEIYLLGINEIRLIDPTLNSIKNINTIDDFFQKNKNYTISRFIEMRNVEYSSIYKNVEYFKESYNQ
ncbi:MAG: molybdenum cofactor guanylyltransferase [Sulfolobaceae archaeon]